MKFLTFKVLLILFLYLNAGVYSFTNEKTAHRVFLSSSALSKMHDDKKDLKDQTTHLFNKDDFELKVGIAFEFLPFANWDLVKNSKLDKSKIQTDIEGTMESKAKESIAKLTSPAATLGLICNYQSKLGKTKTFRCKTESSIAEMIKTVKTYYLKAKQAILNKIKGETKATKSDAQAPADNQSKYVEKLKEEIAKALLKWLFKFAAKHIMAALFPPIIPVIVMWEILQNVKATVKKTAKEDVKEVGIEVELFNVLDIAKIKLYLTMNINVKVLVQAYNNFKNWITNKWSQLKAICAFYGQVLKGKKPTGYASLAEEEIETEMDDETDAIDKNLMKEKDYDYTNAEDEALKTAKNPEDLTQDEVKNDYVTKLKTFEETWANQYPSDSISEPKQNEKAPLLNQKKK